MTAEAYVGPAPASSRVRATGMIGYCPWRHLGDLEGVTVTWHDVGPRGLSDFEESSVSLRRGMTVAERRSTLAHELAHVERGPGYGDDESSRSRLEEHVVELTAALRLIPAFVLDDLPGLVLQHGGQAACDFLGIDGVQLKVAIRAVRELQAGGG